jgi:hypothetical protein
VGRAEGEAGLEGLGLEELMARFPEAWERIGKALVTAVECGQAEAVAELVERARTAAIPWRARLASSRGNPKVLEAALPHLAAERMALLAVQRTALAAASGEARGTFRLSWWSGTLVQRLLFARDLTRKPVSLRAFRLLWPLVGQRRRVMPLVQQRGIYCFYSRELVRELARLVAGRRALEIAAGDGTLARFLRAEGCAVAATDDQSWGRRIAYPSDVERLDARAALERHRPEVVLCSWPPPDNRFEQQVFATPSVQLYLVVASRHRFAAGAWRAYEAQRAFLGAVDEPLSRLVLPPEADPAVLVFRRKT